MDQDIKKLSWNEIILVGERQNFERERAKKIKRKNLFFLPVHTSLRGIGSKRFMEHGYKVLW